MSIGIMWLFAKEYMRRFIGLIAKYPWQIICLCLAIGALWQWDNANDWQVKAGEEKAAHAQSIENWRLAYAQAKQKNLDEVAAIEARRNKIIEKETIKYVYVEKDYRANVANRAGRLPVQANADTSCPIGYGLPVISEMPAGVLSADTAAIVSRTDLDIVATNQAKLEGIVAAWSALESAPSE